MSGRYEVEQRKENGRMVAVVVDRRMPGYRQGIATFVLPEHCEAFVKMLEEQNKEEGYEV